MTAFHWCRRRLHGVYIAQTDRTDDKAAQVVRMRSLVRLDVDCQRRMGESAVETQGESVACESESGSCGVNILGTLR